MMDQAVLKKAGRATVIYIVSGAMVSFELGILISLIWFQKQGWIVSGEAPTTLQIMEAMPGTLSLIVLLAVPMVIIHSLFFLRVLKRKSPETTS